MEESEHSVCTAKVGPAWRSRQKDSMSFFEWNVDDQGVPFHQKGPETFDDYLYTVCWAQTEAKGAIGYQYLGWTRTTPVPLAAQLIDARGRHHMYANHN